MLPRCILLLVLVGPLCSAWFGDAEARVKAEQAKVDKAELGEFATAITKRMDDSMTARLKTLFAKTQTDACRKKITDAVGDYMVSEIEEHGPWMNERTLQTKHNFENLCPKERPVKPRPTKSADDISIFYLVMAHRSPAQTARLIRALQHPNHHFAVHFDGKSTPELRAEMAALAAQHANVRMIPLERSVNVTWGGWGMIEALLTGIETAVHGADKSSDGGEGSTPFDFFMDISESTYPLKSDAFIRGSLATYNPEGNFFGYNKMDVHANEWFSYVECDNVVHRVGKAQLPHGVELQVGSQWVVLTPPFMRYLVADTKQVPDFSTYMRTTRIPDESFLQTVGMISPHCHSIEKVDHTFINWDKNEPDTRKKCLMANPAHCGRSPVSLRIADLPLLQASNQFFARKFDPDVEASMELMDLLDEIRGRGGDQDVVAKRSGVEVNAQWHGSKDDNYVFDDVAIVQEAGRRSGRSVDVVGEDVEQRELCLTVKGHGKYSLKLEPCAAGARQRFVVGPCWGDLEGKPTLRGDGCIAGEDGTGGAGGSFPEITLPQIGKHGRGNRRCSIKPYGQFSHCIDYAGQHTSPGNPALVWDCQRSWNQLFVMRPGTCHLILEPPQEHDGGGKVPLCFTSSTRGQRSSHWEGAVEGKLCEEGNKNQQFFFRDNTEELRGEAEAADVQEKKEL